MKNRQHNRCPACSTSLAADPEQLFGETTCPRCSASLWFVNSRHGTVFLIRRSSDPVAELLQNSPRELDSLDLVELTMEIEDQLRL